MQGFALLAIFLVGGIFWVALDRRRNRRLRRFLGFASEAAAAAQVLDRELEARFRNTTVLIDRLERRHRPPELAPIQVAEFVVYTAKKVKVFYDPLTDAAISLSGPNTFLAAGTEITASEMGHMLKAKAAGTAEGYELIGWNYIYTVADPTSPLSACTWEDLLRTEIGPAKTRGRLSAQ